MHINFKAAKNNAACLRVRSYFHRFQGCGPKVNSLLRDELNGKHVLSSDPSGLSDKVHSNTLRHFLQNNLIAKIGRITTDTLLGTTRLTFLVVRFSVSFVISCNQILDIRRGSTLKHMNKHLD